MRHLYLRCKCRKSDVGNMMCVVRNVSESEAFGLCPWLPAHTVYPGIKKKSENKSKCERDKVLDLFMMHVSFSFHDSFCNIYICLEVADFFSHLFIGNELALI